MITPEYQLSDYLRFRKRRIRFSALLVLIIIALGGFAAQTAPDQVKQLIRDPIEQTVTEVTDTIVEAQPGLAHVTQTIDGDTIEIELNGKTERVRMIGIDTPETHDPRKPVQCFGEAAATHTKQLLEGKNVRLEANPQDADRDKYRRLLRYVYLPDGTLINAKLIEDGYAFAYTVFPHPKLDDFRAFESTARTANRGLWAGCNIDESQKVKQTTSTK